MRIGGMIAPPDLWASYIWPAYILTLGGLTALVIWAFATMRAAEKRVEDLRRK